MELLLARAADLAPCAELDSSYETDFVWQVQTHIEGERIETIVQRTRLPRTVTVHAYPDLRSLRAHWEEHECFLVARHQGRLLGWVDVTHEKRENAAWVHGLVVDRHFRRRGVGRALLKAARIWAEQRTVRVMQLESQPKNHPAISLYLQSGFGFCGYNDQYYADEGIALFFACPLR